MTERLKRGRLGSPVSIVLLVGSMATAVQAAAAPATMPPNGGTIAIVPKTASGDYDPSLQTYTEVAAAAFADRRFTVIDDAAHAAYVAELLLDRADVGTAKSRVPGQRAATLVGVGVAVPLSTGKSELVPVERVRLEIRICRRGEANVVWHGAAVTVRQASAGRGSNETVAADLSRAILSSYPAEPKGDLGVP